MPDGTTSIELLYRGTEVDDGTMPVDDMVDALVGFSGAYAKIARSQFSPEYGHRIRVVGLQRGSAKIIVDVVEWVRQNPSAATALISGASVVGAGVWKGLEFLSGMFKAKKALEGKPLTDNSYVFVNGNLVIGGVQLNRQQIEFLKSGDLDPDMDKMTAPLEEGRGRGVDEFELRARDQELIKVTSKERPYFVHSESALTTTRDDVWLEGVLNSHSKRSNRGMFITLAGKHITYHFSGDDIKPLLRAYAFTGTVKVLGKVKFDSNLEPISIDVKDVQPSQHPLF